MAAIPWFRRIAASLLAGATLCVQAGNFEGIVTHVSDGDTLWVRPTGGGTPRQVRLEGIDAPEICQPYGTRSRDALAARVLRRRVQVVSQLHDSYRRELGRVSVEGQDLGRWMVSNGHAWSYRFRANRGPYAMQQARAKKARLGLWSRRAPIEPRDFRQRHGSCN